MIIGSVYPQKEVDLKKIDWARNPDTVLENLFNRMKILRLEYTIFEIATPCNF